MLNGTKISMLLCGILFYLCMCWHVGVWTPTFESGTGGELAQLRSLLPTGVPFIALTATATLAVKQKICPTQDQCEVSAFVP